jgi:phage-related tail fiber protein
MNAELICPSAKLRHVRAQSRFLGDYIINIAASEFSVKTIAAAAAFFSTASGLAAEEQPFTRQAAQSKGQSILVEIHASWFSTGQAQSPSGPSAGMLQLNCAAPQTGIRSWILSAASAATRLMLSSSQFRSLGGACQ